MISRIILFIIGAYFLLTAGYGLLHAELYAVGTHRLARYVIGPGFLGLGFISAGLWLERSASTTTAVYAASVMFALFLFEGIMTAQSVGVNSSVATELEAEAEGLTQFRQAIPPNYTLKGLNLELGPVDPDGVLLGGVPDQTVLLCRNEAGPVTYRADRYGFRNDDTVYDSAVDVLLLGDSFAEGYCLPDGEHVSVQLMALGPSVVNTGTRGAGPLFELALLDRFGPKLKPPLTVLMFFGGNDWENLAYEMHMEWLTPAMDGAYLDTPLVPDPSRIEAAKSQIEDWWDRDTTFLNTHALKFSDVRNFLALQKTALTLGLHFPKAPIKIPGYERIYKRAAETVASWGGHLMIVYLPPVDQFHGLFSFPAAFDGLPSIVRASAQRNGIAFFDLTEPLYAVDDPAALYAPDAHFNKHGAAFAAKLIQQKIGGL